jgi:hypothetical protein
MTEAVIVLRVIRRIDGANTEADGRYIVDYDPRLVWDQRGRDRAYKLVTSADINKARGFADLAEATQYVRQVCPDIPLRSDGGPNRPLAAFTIEITTRVR